MQLQALPGIRPWDLLADVQKFKHCLAKGYGLLEIPRGAYIPNPRNTKGLRRVRKKPEPFRRDWHAICSVKSTYPY